jgi:RNA polymerase sigma-70 factor (ECF subfamily)
VAELPDADALKEELRGRWALYVDLTAPIRPDLYAYCRRLTSSVWDAEDLVQDTLLRGFGHLGFLAQEVGHLRAYLLRAATNVFIDAHRRRNAEGRVLDERLPTGSRASLPDEHARVRDAAAHLLQRLAPQERAAVVLKDVFELSLREIAEILATSEGAVKHALHRGRERLREPESGPARHDRPSLEVVERFVALYDAKDVPGLVALLVDGGSAENVGFGLQYGKAAFEGTENFLYKAVHGHEEWPASFQPESVRLATGTFEGAALVLCLAARQGREALEQVLRIDDVDGRIARLRGYAFCPQTMREIGAALGHEVRTGLYRVPSFEGRAAVPSAKRTRDR